MVSIISASRVLQVLGESMAGISQYAKNSKLPEFGDSISAASKALCGLTEAAAQVRHSPSPEPYPRARVVICIPPLPFQISGTVLPDSSAARALSKPPCGVQALSHHLSHAPRLPTLWVSQTPTARLDSRAWWTPLSLPELTKPSRWPA